MTDLQHVMPRVSRALKRGDRAQARRLLAPVVGEGLAREAVLELVGAPREPENLAPLTRAQWACLWNVACGLTNVEAAARFHRDPVTVDSHRKGALRALGASTQAGAVAEAYRRGIFDPARPLVPVDW